MFEILHSGLVFDSTRASADERVAFVCSLAPLSNGTILCSFQVGPKKTAPSSHIAIMRSTDRGRNWTRLPLDIPVTYQGISGSLGSGEIAEVAPGKLLLVVTWYDRSDPDRPLFDPVTEGLLYSKLLKAFSTDGGRTWSAWEEIPLHGLTGVATSGPLLRWSDGSIGIPCESFKFFDNLETIPHAAWILRSFDGGASFPELTCVATDPSGRMCYWDQRLCVGENPGEYQGLFWTHDRERKEDISVHFSAGHCGQDAPPRPVSTGIIGQISAPLRTDDGKQIALVVDRNRPATMSLWQSRDSRHWSRDEEAVLYRHEERAPLSQGMTDVDYAQYWEDMGKWTFGHPALLALSPTEFLAVYYAGSPGCLSVHSAVVGRAEALAGRS